MRPRRWMTVASLLATLASPPAASAPIGLALSEIVADPQSDWNGDGTVTASDEYVELANLADGPMDLSGWRLWLNDTTPVLWNLSGTIAPGDRLALVNPPGELNNNAHVALLAPDGAIVDEVRYGRWKGNDANVPDADAQHALNEALRRVAGAWVRGHGTPNAANDQPHFFHAPPFDSGDTWWDPGNRTRAWNLALVDADRTFSAVLLRVEADNATAIHTVPTTVALGRITGALTLATPRTDFSYSFRLLASNGVELNTTSVGVRVDREAPPAPAPRLPSWSSQANASLVWNATVDSGIGSVSYRVEAAPTPEGPWTTLHDWAPQPADGQVEAPTDQWIRLLARDAYNNTAPPTAPLRSRLDASPPPAPTQILARGYRELELAWTPPADNESGLQEIRIERTAPRPRLWVLPANASGLTDSDLRLGERSRYQVQAFDAAGNSSPRIDVEPDYAGLYPHLASLRIAKQWWGPGVQTIHLDFDRPMDPSKAPLVELRTAAGASPLSGRWLANRSTYLIQLRDGQAHPAGEAAVAVLEAPDAHDRALANPTVRSFFIDRDPPTLFLPESLAWINATGFRLEVSDRDDPRPLLRYKVWADGVPEPADYSRADAPPVIAPAGDRVHVAAVAQDRAGNEVGPVRRTLRVDRAPPQAAEVRWAGPGTLHVRILDEGSGWDPNRTVFALAQGPLPWRPGGGRDLAILSLPPGQGSVNATLVDKAGNTLHQALSVPEAPPAPSPSPPRRSTPPPTKDGSNDEASLARPAALPEPVPPAGAPGPAPAWALVALIGAALAGRRRGP